MEAATEHYFEDAFARVGMTNCKSVVTPGIKRVAPAPDSQETRPLNSEEHSTYRQGVGKLQFIVGRRARFVVLFEGSRSSTCESA